MSYRYSRLQRRLRQSRFLGLLNRLYTRQLQQYCRYLERTPRTLRGSLHQPGRESCKRRFPHYIPHKIRPIVQQNPHRNRSYQCRWVRDHRSSASFFGGGWCPGNGGVKTVEIACFLASGSSSHYIIIVQQRFIIPTGLLTSS